MLKIKLFLKGKRNQRTFRIVVAEAKSRRDGKYTDELGWWDPAIKKGKVDQDKLNSWINKGAKLTIGSERIIDLVNSSKK